MNYSENEDTSEKILSRRVQGEALQIMVSGLWPDFEEISKTSINKAPFLLFSNPFVTLRSYRVPMELFWLQNDINSCSIACRNRDFKW